jgi:hypothetical protein
MRTIGSFGTGEKFAIRKNPIVKTARSKAFAITQNPNKYRIETLRFAHGKDGGFLYDGQKWDFARVSVVGRPRGEKDENLRATFDGRKYCGNDGDIIGAPRRTKGGFDGFVSRKRCGGRGR